MSNGDVHRAYLVCPAMGRLVLAVGLTALVPGIGCTNPLAGLGTLGELLPSAEELQQYEQQLTQFSTDLANMADVPVRIVNDTEVVARVELTSAVQYPVLPSDEISFPGVEEAYLTPLDTQTVTVAAHGTAHGTLKCGEVLALAADAPVGVLTSVFDADSEAFGLYVSSGNVALGGVGRAGERAFTGNVLNTIRFVRPADDGLDCATGTLVLTIAVAATPDVYDPATGNLVSAGTAGSGTVSIE